MENLSNKKVDYNIEYAHIYSDQDFGEEQVESIKIAKEIIALLNKLNKSYVLSVLIDEYHPIKPKNNIYDFLELLDKNGLKPDYIALESKMVKDSLIVFNEIQNSKLKNGYRKYLERKQKSPCSLLTAVWYLKRLGEIKISENDFIYKNKRPFAAEKLITILPQKYKETEKKALDIIISSSYNYHIRDIINLFFSY